MKKLATQREIVNNIFDYGDEVICYVTFKEGGKSRINIYLISLTITQVITKRKRVAIVKYTNMGTAKIKGNILIGNTMRKLS